MVKFTHAISRQMSAEKKYNYKCSYICDSQYTHLETEVTETNN